MSYAEEGKRQQFFVLRTLHLILIVLGWVVISVAQFVTLRDQSADNERRIQELETRPVVTREVYENGQKAIEQRLDRIENKLDREQERRH